MGGAPLSSLNSPVCDIRVCPLIPICDGSRSKKVKVEFSEPAGVSTYPLFTIEFAGLEWVSSHEVEGAILTSYNVFLSTIEVNNTSKISLKVLRESMDSLALPWL
jgi:hypothetical protein